MNANAFELEHLCGKPVWDFFPYLLRCYPDISELRIQKYRPAPKLSERLAGILSTHEQGFLTKVDEIRRTTGVPFWDVFLGLAMREEMLNGPMAQSALLHDLDARAETFLLARHEVNTLGFETLNQRTALEEGLVVCSRVTLQNGDIRHIPMIDFRCPPSTTNAAAIQGLLAKVQQSFGILVESGKSYHLYGLSLLTQDQWVKFLAVCLLLAPVTDSRYIAHRLADGECRLKIAAHDGTVPRITRVLYGV